MLVVLLAVADYLTGPELSFSIFYLIPIAIASWYGDRRVGLLMCFLSAAAWLTVDLELASYSHPAIHYWNSLVRLGFFVAVSLLSSEIVASRQRQEELVRLIAHDLRAPLRNAMLGLDVLEHESGPGMDPAARKVVNLTRNSGMRMWPLIHALAELAQFDTAEIPLDPRDVPVERLLDEAFDQINLWAWNRGVRLENEIGPQVTGVHADPDVTVRVLVNLLTRLVEARPPDSIIRVDVDRADPATVRFHMMSESIDLPALANGDASPESAATSAADPDGDLGLRFCEQAMQAQHGTVRLAYERGEVVLTLPTAAT